MNYLLVIYGAFETLLFFGFVFDFFCDFAALSQHIAMLVLMIIWEESV